MSEIHLICELISVTGESPNEFSMDISLGKQVIPLSLANDRGTFTLSSSFDNDIVIISTRLSESKQDVTYKYPIKKLSQGSKSFVILVGGIEAEVLLDLQDIRGDYLSFFSVVGKLKKEARTGWIIRNVENVESVADHSWRMGIMSTMDWGVTVNRIKLLKMTLVHDLAEALCGDILPEDCGLKEVMSRSKKMQLETSAMEKILEPLKDTIHGKELKSIWDEYNKRVSPEALLCKDFDRLEMCFQALEYEKAQSINLEEFLASTKGKIKNKIAQSIFAQLEKQHEAIIRKFKKNL